MDEANADMVKTILSGDGEEYDALNPRIEAILDGEDTALARQLQEYLSALMGMDEPKVLAADDYIYFDLAAGNVNIGKSSYTGWVYVAGTATKVTGIHKSENKYYVYQSNPDAVADSPTHPSNTGYALEANLTAKQNCRVPTYDRVRCEEKSWRNYVTNNTDVYAVSRNWETAAAASGRTRTPYNITFSSESEYTADVTIDNIWSSYHEPGSNKQYDYRTSGGIGANLSNQGIRCTDTHIKLSLKGDNRVGCVHYSARKEAGNTIEFYNGETDSTPGSITVADFPDGWKKNFWSSAIGGADSPGNADPADGIVIHSGVIYAGTTSADDSTAIGGGGNNFGGVTIKGGTVTAVAASTGTAIGGGIGWGSQGGDANVTISGGTVYAYNLGIGPDSGNYGSFVPAAAIGGGSASTNHGNANTLVEITGGFVYAQSVAGAAIGGGGSGTQKGGDATVNISGGTVIAKSIGGEVNYNKGGNTKHKETVSPGVSIGGGTGSTGGGSVTLNVSQVSESNPTILRTGSIGGGKTTSSTGNIGSATVEITGGDITGQVIMAGGAAKSCSFTMSGGKIHSTNVVVGNKVTDIVDPRPDVTIQYLQKNGGAVWMDDANGVTSISGGTIENCTAELGGAIYMTGGNFTLSGTGNISGNTAEAGGENTGLGGAVYISGGTVNIEGGSIGGEHAANKAQDGAGVYVNGGSANVSGGHVQYNESSRNGGGLYVTGGNVNVSGGFINNNIAAERGGGVYLPGGDFTMTGGTISGNTANIRGGGIFLTKAPSLTTGTISGNTATDSGGGVCINGDRLELSSPKMKIYGNNAANGGGVAVLNGTFILDGGAVGVAGKESNTAGKGGGVYVANDAGTSTGTGNNASATVKSGNIWYNSATEGGGIYLAKGEGDFTLEGENASISHNSARRGGGVYLYKNPVLNQGKIEANTADENGGGMYISDCLVTLSPANDVTITGNNATNGAGIYIHGNSSNSGSSGNLGSSVDAVSSATPTQRVGLLVGSDFAGTVSFTNNKATDSGGAVCVNAGRFQLESDKITVTDNHAANGGGVAVLHGNFTMTAGSIGEEKGANHAANGGGVYVSSGEVWLKGGSVKYNTATNGGGAYVTGGNFTMMGGSLENNTADENGGGGYVAGNFHMLGGTIGGAGTGNSAKNGGGVYVNEGNAEIVYGIISHNSADQDGGGFFISAADSTVKVLMLSGSLSSNQAARNGGGMAVESTNDQAISVDIGCLLNHNLQNGRPTYPISYVGKYDFYAQFDGEDYTHNSCPEVKNNIAGNIGGGFYLNSKSSTLSFFCVEESGNTAAKGKENSEGMDVEGGRVVIGDEYYHNYKHDGLQSDPHGVPWGYVSMDNATLVSGGQVDIYGDMTNPVFKDEVTVDIEDVNNDHFMDHRRSKDGKRYKVHYIENFFGTGLYQAFQYDEGNTKITIEGALYSHPGYKLLGWYTKADYNPAVEDPDNRFYPVGETFDLTKESEVPNLGQNPSDCEHCDSKKDDNLLMLYAIWEANGYTVVFDPNVPQGNTYTGSMDDQVHQYGLEKELTQNAYQYPGHFFKSWNTKADGTGTAYADGQKVSNLTDKNGAKVVLYAQWEICDHKDPERWSYDVIDGQKTLRRICSCGGQTLTATLYASDTVYDGYSHPATLILDDQEAWDSDAPTIKYEGKRLNDNDTQLYGELKFDKDNIPYHAGVYTASITKKNGETPVTASIQYTIAKADQEAPEKPTYDVPGEASGKQVLINKLDKDPNEFTDDAGNQHKAKAEYCLTYHGNQNIEWKKFPDGAAGLAIDMNTALTNYIVAARYEELEDYNASAVTRADAVYFYAGNVTVKISCDEGIDYEFVPTDGHDPRTNGATLTLTTKEGYYLVGGDYSVEAKLEKDGTEKPFNPTEGPDDVYSFSKIDDNSTLTITIGKARKSPAAKAQVVPRQVFSPFTGTETTISRDSAFTAAFQVSNFDPNVYDGLNLTFNNKIPVNTTVILLDRRDGTYWYYRVESEVTSVPLTVFKKMGGSGTYNIPQPAQTGDYIDLSYQFIVDFSQSADGYSNGSLTMKLEAPVKEGYVPEVHPEVKVSMADSAFTFKGADMNGLTCGFTCSFNAGGAASKWENRASALVLKPEDGTDLPPDAQIKAETGSGTTYLYRSDDSFIVPLSLLQTGDEEEVKLTLQSALFPAGETSYSFTAKWLISPSEAGKAPMIGDEKRPALDVTFTSAAKIVPSLKITGQDRILASGQTLKLNIEKKNMNGYTISAALLRKSEDGTYNGTGWNQTSVSASNLSIPLGGQAPGSFCLMLTVKQTDSITVVMEVPYYFVISEATPN